MKILITGTRGQVGYALTRQLKDYEIVSLRRKDCDFMNLEKIKKSIDEHKPDLIINPAAYTNVDQAENEKQLAFLINRDAPKVIAEKAKEQNIPFIHFSTDYVFDGKKRHSYIETDKPNPLGVYGQSKYEGEEAIQDVGGKFFIIRCSWIYSNIGRNFYLTIKKLSLEKKFIKVVSDQYGSPTSNLFIAEQIEKLVPKLDVSNTGIYHLVSEGSCSWHEFAKLILKKSNSSFDLSKLYSIRSDQLETSKIRPQNSRLNNEKIKNTFMISFNSWKTEFNRVVNDA